VAVLRGGRLRVRGLIPGRSKRYFCSPFHQTYSPSHTYCNSTGLLYWGISPWGMNIDSRVLRICRSIHPLSPPLSWHSG
jgi:hypothetical protein